MKEYDLFVKYYEEVVRPEEGQLDDELYFLNEVIEDFKPDVKEILECACGTGLVMNELIKKGFKVTGLDLSEKMLEKAKKLMPEEELLKEDMTNFDLGKKFDMVLCNYNSICHLLKFEDWNNFMRCANNHLKDGGLLVFDINTLFEFNSLAEDYNMTKEMGNDTLCLDVKKTEEHFYWDVKMFVKGDDGRYDLVRERVSENSFEIADVKKALEENGFFLEGLVDYHTLEVTPESERVYFIASKK